MSRASLLNAEMPKLLTKQHYTQFSNFICSLLRRGGVAELISSSDLRYMCLSGSYADSPGKLAKGPLTFYEID